MQHYSKYTSLCLFAACSYHYRVNLNGPSLEINRLFIEFLSLPAFFLLLSRYVPNVHGRGVHDVNVFTDDRPTDESTTYLASWTFRMGISLQRIIRSTSCLVLWYGFRGQRIEWRYFRFDQIQDGGRLKSWKISNGHILSHYL